MLHANSMTRSLRARAALVLCATLLTTGAMAASPKLESIAVTPNAKSISVGQKQSFTATGTFSNGSKPALGPALSNMATGYWATCALLTSGGVECWGWNGHGELGYGRKLSSLIPRAVKGISTATAVAFGMVHACAVLASGAVQCWGSNQVGGLGNGTDVWESTIPVPVTGISTATAVSLGWEDSCALLASGAVQCWGFNGYGELGNGTGVWESNIPVSVVGISTATALTLGSYHSCAVLAGGAVQCWGFNYWGQLGDGTKTDSNTPVTVTGISTATALALGSYYSCALLASGAVQCWGYNASGQLGDGSNTNSNIPVSVTGISTAIAITAGGSDTCAVLRDGSVKCWGSNEHGQLGNGTTTNSNIPVRVSAISAPTKLAANGEHTCALFSGGMMRCWGWDNYGQLGNRRTNDNPSPLPVTVVGTPGVVWQSSDPSRATITDRGVATARAVGNTTVTATTAGFINDNAVLTVK